MAVDHTQMYDALAIRKGAETLLAILADMELSAPLSEYDALMRTIANDWVTRCDAVISADASLKAYTLELHPDLDPAKPVVLP